MRRLVAAAACAALISPSPAAARLLRPALPRPAATARAASLVPLSPAAPLASPALGPSPLSAPVLEPAPAPAPALAPLSALSPLPPDEAGPRPAVADLAAVAARLTSRDDAALLDAAFAGSSVRPVGAVLAADAPAPVPLAPSGPGRLRLYAGAAAAHGAAAASGATPWLGWAVLVGGIVALLLLTRWIEGSVGFQHYLARRRWSTASGKSWRKADDATRAAVKARAQEIVAANRAGRTESWGDFKKGLRLGRREPARAKSETQAEAAPPAPAVTFADVAGQPEAKAELVRVVDFLKDPARYKALGAKGFKGVLLFGPPGTGKTLMARAVAGEAGAAFVDRKGSDFVNRFVGVGPDSVRKAFEQARGDGTKPGILFIDEIDAVGRKRSDGDGNQEYENTLNALLAEMSDPKNGNVVLFAATNRPELLDPALMRGRRFGLQVPVGLPDAQGREQILRVHARDMRLAADADLAAVARLTPKLSGADLEEIANDAAMMAAERGAAAVEMADFRKAIDRRTIGHERRLVMDEEEKAVVSFHESGHALTAWLLPGADPIRKVTIVPHGLQALGLVQTVSEQERSLYSRQWLLDRIAVALGGRVAEELALGETYSGAQNDLEQATRLARLMVMKFGMSPKVGRVSYDLDGERPAAGKALSEAQRRLIEAEVRLVVERQHERVTRLLTENRAVLDRLAAALRERETLREADLDALLPPRPSKT